MHIIYMYFVQPHGQQSLVRLMFESGSRRSEPSLSLILAHYVSLRLSSLFFYLLLDRG